MKEKFKKIIRFITNPRLLLCIALAWLITNGWSYILFAIGTAAKIHWMTAVSGAYIAFLWLPVSPEKIVTFAIALGLLRLLFPNDQKTLAVLRQLYQKAKQHPHPGNRNLLPFYRKNGVKTQISHLSL